MFQNNIGPMANMQLRQLLLSMKQKSPELEIPEEVFYGGIPNCNLYVQHKDLETGMLYGVMIYRMTESFEDAAIILADSGRLQSTADKMHLKLTLYSGEWFENMRSQEMAGNANVPYRRESFISKVILLDFDNGFNLAEASGIAQMAAAQSLPQLIEHIDSVKHVGDSLGHVMAADMKRSAFETPKMSKGDSVKAVAMADKEAAMLDTVYNRLSPEQQRSVMQRAASRVQMATMDTEFRGMVANDVGSRERDYRLEVINKFTLSLTCLIFFFIGASLGAIIRKGGLGVPVIISVLVFIVFYILDNTGTRMAKQASWTIAFGKGLAPAVLIPIAVFVTYKANKDSVVFNMDAYRMFFMRLFGLRLKRNVASKEVIINDPDYMGDARRLKALSATLEQYSQEHKLVRLPNPVNVFFKYKRDTVIEQMAAELEEIIEDLGNTRDRYVLSYLNQYPVVSEKAHTRPFDTPWMNKAAAVIFPVGIILYIRMCRFRLRLYKDLRQIMKTNALMTERIDVITQGGER